MTKGIDQKTGRPLDYDPNKDVQTYVGVGNLLSGTPPKKLTSNPALTLSGYLSWTLSTDIKITSLC